MKYEDLKILDELREKGSITEEEFQCEKAKILAEDKTDYSGTFKRPFFGMEERTYLMLMHLSQFASWLIPFVGIVIPILMWTTNKDRSDEVDKHGKNILNFNISYAIYSIALLIIIIGIPFIIILLVIYAIAVIIASIKANDGKYWEYPLTIKFIK
ncbi:MAG: DUF4870 domain-containing protein [Dysgonamonadaceae bacterium]|nr:DUF4870 domain-containing protein [Dysgonamonadaceae bacterium]MDD4728171.1 DUF4870 domain-containing protein [Dysgonamonadaceae bacterium]